MQIHVSYLEKLKRRWGKVKVIMDRAPQHRAKVLREFLRKNPNVKWIYLPKDPPPYLNAVEECGHQAKRRCRSEYYASMSGMTYRISEYFRTMRLCLDVEKYRNRIPILISWIFDRHHIQIVDKKHYNLSYIFKSIF